MAYFANGSEGARFEDECTRCKFGDKPCPIAWVQMEYNYDAVGNDTARAILDYLVKDNGECAMLRQFPELEKNNGAMQLLGRFLLLEAKWMDYAAPVAVFRELCAEARGLGVIAARPPYEQD